MKKIKIESLSKIYYGLELYFINNNFVISRELVCFTLCLTFWEPIEDILTGGNHCEKMV